MSSPRRYGPVPKLQAVMRPLLEAFENGLPQRTAANLVGVSYNTVHRWLVNGEQELRWQEQEDDPAYAAATLPTKYHDGIDRHPLYAEFFVSVCQARAAHQKYLVERIKDAAGDPRHWTAAAWLLERGDPNQWAQKATQAGAGGIDPAALIPEDQQERAANALLEQLAIQKRLPGAVIEVKAS